MADACETTRRLKVAHVVLSLDVGGLERNVVNQIRLASEVGQEVSVICIETPGALAAQARSLGGTVVCVDKPPGLRPGVVKRIRGALRDIRPDVVHTHQIGPLFYTGLAAVGLQIPLLVHTEHGKQNYAGRRQLRWLGRAAGRFAKVFYCLSQDMADAVIAAGIVPVHKTRVIKNGIDTAFYRQPRDTAAIRRSLGIPPTAPLVGTIGRLNEIKRQDVLLEAFKQILTALPDAHLILVGDGPLLQALRDQAGRLGVADRVHFVGYQADTTPFLHAMDVFTLTSRSEGMPQSLLEACVAEVPAIVSRVGGMPEVIRDGATGLLFEPGDVGALARGLLTLLVERQGARRMASAASAHVVARFDIRRMATEYHADFLRLLAGDPVAAGTVAAPLAAHAVES
jgi:glycosyltransferase involved in cell wall biosynthesis